jgi:hypothetical protein
VVNAPFSSSFNSVAGTPVTLTNLTFYASTDGGGLSAGNGESHTPGNFNVEGDQVYTGSESAPVFSPGVFSECNDGPGFCDTLTVSATPLPSTWLMLLSGFVGLGFFAYHGAKKNSAVAA